MKRYKIPLVEIFEALVLDGEIVRWGDRPIHHFDSEKSFKRYNTLFKGKEFGYISDGYRQGSLVSDGKNRRLLYHVAKWVLKTSVYPNGIIDHKDGNGLNNEWSNLRDVTRTENSRNAKKRIDNTSGVNGVHFDKRSSLWVAQGYETINGVLKNVWLGYHEDIESASLVRREWEKSINCSERHGR